MARQGGYIRPYQEKKDMLPAVRPPRQPRRQTFNHASGLMNAATTAATLAPINPYLAIPGAVAGYYFGGKSGPFEPSAADYQPFRNAFQNYQQGAMRDLQQGVNEIGQQSSQRVASQGLYGSPLGQSVIQNNQNWTLRAGLDDINKNRYQFENMLANQQFSDQRAYDQQMQQQWVGTLNNLAFNALPIYNQYFRTDPNANAQQQLLNKRFDRLEQPPVAPALPDPETMLPGANRATGLALMGVQPPPEGTPVQAAPNVTMAGPNAPAPQFQGPAGGSADYWTQPQQGQWGQQQTQSSESNEMPSPEVQAAASAIIADPTKPIELKQAAAIDPELALEIEQAFGDVLQFESAEQWTLQGEQAPAITPPAQSQQPPTAIPAPWELMPQNTPPTAVPPPWTYFQETPQPSFNGGMEQMTPQGQSEYAMRDLPIWDTPYLMTQDRQQLSNMRDAIHAGLQQTTEPWARQRLEEQLSLVNQISDRKRRQAERKAKVTATALGGLEQLGDRSIESTARPSPTPVVNPFAPAEPGSAYTIDYTTDLVKYGEGPMLRNPTTDPKSGYNVGWGRNITYNGLDVQSELIPMLRQSYPNDFQIQRKLEILGIPRSHAGHVTMTPAQFKQLFPFGISETQAQMLLRNDIERSEQDVVASIGSGVYYGLDPDRQSVLLDMMHTLGRGRFQKFVKMIGALQRGNYYEAAYEMRNSQWYHDVRPRRANPLIRKMIGDNYQAGDISSFAKRARGR